MGFRLFWPTQFNALIQAFGVNRTGVANFYTKYGLPAHEGLDFRAPSGSKIFACADGIISEISRNGYRGGKAHAYGIQIRIKHYTDEGEFETIYGHLKLVLKDLKVGDEVSRAQLIGYADNTGNSRGDHLHLTVKKKGASTRGETTFVINGKKLVYPLDIIDPTPYLDPFGTP